MSEDKRMQLLGVRAQAAEVATEIAELWRAEAAAFTRDGLPVNQGTARPDGVYMLERRLAALLDAAKILTLELKGQ